MSPNPQQIITEAAMLWTSDFAQKIGEHAMKHLREACTITTMDQLKACPRGTAVRGADGHLFKREPAEDGEDYWAHGEIELPALLLWHPDWAAS